MHRTTALRVGPSRLSCSVQLGFWPKGALTSLLLLSSFWRVTVMAYDYNRRREDRWSAFRVGLCSLNLQAWICFYPVTQYASPSSCLLRLMPMEDKASTLPLCFWFKRSYTSGPWKIETCFLEHPAGRSMPWKEGKKVSYMPACGDLVSGTWFIVICRRIWTKTRKLLLVTCRQTMHL